MRWTEEQLQVIERPLQHTAVLACAGSGKTATIVERVTRIVANSSVSADRIAIITFTNLAADQLVSRIAAAFHAAGITGLPYVGTIHGYCLHLLKEFQPETGDGLSVLNEAKQFALFFSKFREWGLGALAPDKSRRQVIETLVRSMEICDLEGITDCSSAVTNEAYPQVVAHYIEWCESNGFIDYSMMLSIFRGKLGESAFYDFVTGQLDLLIVDEYQDTDPIQGEIFQILGSKVPITVVGDDDQCIYQFRGTTHENIVHFREQFSGAAELHLSTNFRSANNIVRFASGATRWIPDRIPKSMQACRDGGAVIFRGFESLQDEARFVSSEIARLLQTQQVSKLDEVALLFRSVASGSAEFLKALREEGIPFRVRGDGQLLEQMEIRQILAALELIQADSVGVEDVGLIQDFLGSDSILREDLNEDSDFCAMTFDELTALGFTSEKAILLTKILGLREVYARQKFSSCLDFFLRLLNELGVNREDVSESTHRNVAQLTQVIADHDEVIGGRSIRQLINFLRAYGSGAFDAATEWSPDIDAVNVLTVHQAKGLEFEVVFLPMLIDGRFPIRRRGIETFLDSEKIDLGRYSGREADEARLFYVATTRAVDSLYLLTSAHIGGKRKAIPSRFLSNVEKYISSSDLARRPKGAEESTRLTTSYSQLEYYLSCPYRYKLRFDYGYSTPTNPFFSYGRLLHLVLRLAHEIAATGTMPQLADLISVYEKLFPDLRGVPPLTRRRLWRRGIGAIEDYLTNKIDWLEQTAYTELPFRYSRVVEGWNDPVHLTLAGQVDLIINGPNGLHVIDFKTGSPHPYIRTDLQLKLYCSALKQTHSIAPTLASVLYIENGEEVIHEATDSWVHEGTQEIDEGSYGIARREFHPTPGVVCSRCEMTALCAYRRL